MKRVAIIDDDEGLRKVLRGYLEDAGYEVVAEGSDGSEALSICSSTSPDVLLLDIAMTNVDGLSAAAELNTKRPTAIVLITANDDRDTLKKAAEAGVMGYLAKPVREEELIGAVELASSMFGEFSRLKKENDNLKDLIEARKVIERAKGLLMDKEGLTEKEAFIRLRKASMDKRMNMKDIAEVILSTHEGIPSKEA